MFNENTKKLDKIFQKYGYDVRFVGGCVRDYLLKTEPKDIDFCTNATPDKMIEICQKENIKYYETGLKHGTLTINIGDENFEVTTLRIDVSTDGRHAEIEYTNDWSLDAERRDLTINAMSMDMNGKLYDYFGGYEDLKNYVVKFVGEPEKRIQEDYLRILRYFRFYNRFADEKSITSKLVHEDNLKIIKNNIEGMKKISGERIHAELTKIFSNSHDYNYMKDLNNVGFWKILGTDFKPELFDVSRLPYIMNMTKNPIIPYIYICQYESNTKEQALEKLDKLNDKLKFSSHEYNKIKNVISFYRDVKNDIYHDGTFFKLRKVFAKAYMDKTNVDHFKTFLQYVGEFDYADNFEFPVFPVKGEDLIKLGMKPGKHIGEKLEQIKQKWLDTSFRLTKQQLLDFIVKEQNEENINQLKI